MKTILFLLTTILVLSCNQKAKTDGTEKSEEISKTDTIQNFDWLLGKWKRLNEKEGKETFENWDKITPEKYSGVGYTIQKKDTISYEKMDLIKSNESWSLFVKTKSENNAIEFKVVELKKDQFTCSNDSIDFPKNIKYWLADGKLNAKISNKEMEIPFLFEKLK